MLTKDSKIQIYSAQHTDVQGYTMEDIKNWILEFVKQQEKQEDLK